MSHSYLCKAGNNAERQLCASTDFIALILNVLRIKERLQNDYICLNISNVTDGDALASHTTTNQEYIGRVQTLVWYFHFCSHNIILFEHLTINAKVLQTMKTGSTKPPYSHIIHQTDIRVR